MHTLKIHRRRLLQAAALLAAPVARAATVPAAPAAPTASAVDPFAPSPRDGWRVFELHTRIALAGNAGAARVWVPLPSFEDDAWVMPMGSTWQGNARAARLWQDPRTGARLVEARWAPGTPAPTLDVRSRVATRDRAVDLTKPGRPTPLDEATRRRWTAPTRLLPTDGIVRRTALQITQGASSDLDKARAIYQWIVVNTERDPKVRGCGTGDIRFMLMTRDLKGKCADLNALFVGLARSIGLPARDYYGIRVAASKFGYKSLGASGDVTHAQHCRADVWLDDYGWVPVDPADVRKVVLEERPGLTLASPVVADARRTLFGAWEMNWVPYNCAQDVALPDGATLPFLMYPQGRDGDGALDSLDAQAFSYRIEARELTGTVDV